MDEARTPPPARRRAARWRSGWVTLGIPAAVLAILTASVLAAARWPARTGGSR